MFRVLVNRYHPKSAEALLKFLPRDQLTDISSVHIHSDDLRPILQHPQNAISRIHYSWIKPLVDKFPERLQPAIIAALNAEQIAGIKAPLETPITDLAKSFIINKLCYELNIQHRIPIEYLTLNEFSPLANWSKQQLVNLIDFLGLYDLAAEVRHIVNRDHLKNIYTCLTPKQFHYLKVCLHQKEKLTTPKLGIDPSKQDCTKLTQIIHRRGLSRLGKALCGQHPDFVWYLAHTLDTGRGAILLKEYQPQELPKVTSLLKQQVVNVMNFLKSE